MLRLSICATVLVCGTAFAAQPADSTPLASAAPTQVFPPLPPLASLPPTAGAADVDTPAPASSHHARKSRHTLPVKHAPEFQVRLVVTEESRAALAAIDKKLDDALDQPAHDRRAIGYGTSALAMSK
ncbi:hypothetical protein DID96_34500 [Burkholderia sp. Bp8963]|uniref:hypothetical protein n=1 Tax=Burkholderia sp. Bp8963 TaxID=2184547 RepID=UPI000F59C644|nr:hypothetical protein [Burkholderia sp. Bp8963]RQS60670.1 hypothetical protein DID96_34500 [Burkholderia sp. Bp8963]